MMTFKQLFETERAKHGWNSQRTAEHFSRLLGRSVATIYRYIEGRCPDAMLQIAVIKTRPSIAAMIREALKS